MNSLFEYSDRLNAPFECFLFDTRIHSFPIRSHWHYFVEILYMLEGTAIINCDDDTYVLEEGDMTLFLPQAIHSIYTATEQPLVYYVMKFDLNQLAPSGNALSTTFSGINFVSLFNLAKGDSHAPKYFSKAMLTDYPIAGIFSSCEHEMQQQEYGYRILVQSQINSLLTFILRFLR